MWLLLSVQAGLLRQLLLFNSGRAAHATAVPHMEAGCSHSCFFLDGGRLLLWLLLLRWGRFCAWLLLLDQVQGTGCV